MNSAIVNGAERMTSLPVIDISEIPDSATKSDQYGGGQWATIANQIVALPSGKCLAIPLSMFPDGQLKNKLASIRMSVGYRGFICHFRRTPETVYIWRGEPIKRKTNISPKVAAANREGYEL